MMFRLALVLEIMAVIVCIYRLYGRKVKLDIETAVLYLSCLTLFGMMNLYGYRRSFAVGAYVLIWYFCVCRQKDSVKGAAFSVVLMMIVIAIMQFICALALCIFFTLDEAMRAVCVNALVLGGSVLVLPKCRLHKLRGAVMALKGFNILMLGFGCCIVFGMIYQERKYGGLQMELFVFAVPATTLLFLLASKWNVVQCEKQDLEKELQVTMTMQEKYEEIIRTIRMRQHEFKNHLAAILSAQYTYKSYDKLIKAQQEYGDKIVQENKYHTLLGLGNNTLAGFLYGKFQEIESYGTKVEWQIKGTLQASPIPVHHLIEMLGILLDNASQAVHGRVAEEGVIRFDFVEGDEGYQFQVWNRFAYASYDEISEWFEMGKSTKGEGRGIGLYHMKCLCEELDCEIQCRNVEAENENWIEFVLCVGKADSK